MHACILVNTYWYFIMVLFHIYLISNMTIYYFIYSIVNPYSSLCPILCFIRFCFSYWYVGVLERSSVEYNFPLPIHLGGSDGKASTYNAGDPGSIPGSGSSPGEGDGYPLQYSCQENSTDRGAWWATVHGVAKSQTQLSDSHFHFSVLGEYTVMILTSFWLIDTFIIIE